MSAYRGNTRVSYRILCDRAANCRSGALMPLVWWAPPREERQKCITQFVFGTCVKF